VFSVAQWALSSARLKLIGTDRNSEESEELVLKGNRDLLKKEMLKRFTRQQNVFLATAEGDQPRLRPVTLIRFQNRFFFATGSDNAKVKQIRNNPKTEFCLMFGRKGSRGTIRAECIATFVMEKKTKANVFDNVPLFHEFWKSPEDSSYVLIELKPLNFEYYRPGDKEATKVKP
jgi:uncharacterized pyridoxamine 5'-phosphate oxidase family protein